MRARCLPFSNIPHSTRLFAEYTSSFSGLQNFYSLSPHDNDGLRARASQLRYPASIRAAVTDILERQNQELGLGAETMKNIARLRSGAAAMVTGQQVVLLGGPLFAVYKALSVVKRARQLSEQGTDCVPVFWLATEDHDFPEVSRNTLRSADGGLHSLALPAIAPEGTPVGKIAMGEQGSEVIRQAAMLLPEGQFRDLVTECYAPRETLGSAFGKLFGRLFASVGLVLLDPSAPELHRLAAPVFRDAGARSAEIVDALEERSKALERAGYHAQVKIAPSMTLLFADVEDIRKPVRRAGHEFVVGDQRFSAKQLDACIAERPEKFSPNVLLRPVIQDFLLPTVAYVGGPAEVAYFAQVSVVYEKLLGNVTPVLPRFSATLLDPRTQRHLQHYKLSVPECFRSVAELRQLLASRTLPPELDATFTAAQRELNVILERVTEAVSKLDSTLHDAAEHSASKMLHQLTQLQARAARAQAMRNAEVSRHAEVLSNTLYPNQKLQEREIAGISFLSQCGTETLDKIYGQIDLTCTGHAIVAL